MLEAHPAVRHAVAVGYPDELMGERVAAFVVADAAFDVDAARAWFARTRRREVQDAGARRRRRRVPLLPTGKPDRAALRRAVVPG